MTIGERIKQRRIELGLSQDELSRKMGYKTRNAIYQFEQKDNMKLSLIEKFAEALDTTPAYLMGWDEMKQEVERLRAEQIKEIDILRLKAKYNEEQIERALNFVQAFMSASPERQKIALEILQSRQEDS